jgi:23S rRNA pseudouridine2605 synthase
MKPTSEEGIRLQKILAAAGIGSRRMCEELIDEGRVTIDGNVVTSQGVRVKADEVEIRVDGELISPFSDKTVLLFNKPVGVLTTMHDEMHRPCVGDYVVDRAERLFHVGRLDADTDGLLILTNDGQLANHLTHPTFGVSKTYLVRIPAPVPKDIGKQVKTGVVLDDGLARFDEFRVINSTKSEALVEVVLHEGRNRIIRRVFETLGIPIRGLTRVAIGPVQLRDLKSGQLRRISSGELKALRLAAGLAE